MLEWKAEKIPAEVYRQLRLVDAAIQRETGIQMATEAEHDIAAEDLRQEFRWWKGVLFGLVVSVPAWAWAINALGGPRAILGLWR